MTVKVPFDPVGRNPVGGLEADRREWWMGISDDLERIIKHEIKKGKSVSAAVDIAVRKTGLNEKLEDYILDDVMKALAIGRGKFVITAGGQVEATRDWFLHHHWDGQKYSLYQTLARQEHVAIIKETLIDGLKANNTVEKIARDIRDGKYTPAKLPQALDELALAGRRVGIKIPVDDFKNQIAREGFENLKTPYLKSAYSRLDKAIQSGKPERIDKAYDAAIRNKARYEAERIARTEANRAYDEGVQERLEIGPDADIITGWRYTLSGRHEVVDQCTFHATADLYGMGEGAYPVGQGPELPQHPHCMCYKVPIYGGDKILKKDYNPKKAVDWMRKHPKERRVILGVKGDNNFRRNPAGWQRTYTRKHGQTFNQRLGLEIPKSYVAVKE